MPPAGDLPTRRLHGGAQDAVPRALQFAGPLPGYLLAGCGLILLYAAVEFPFGNPAVTIAFWLTFFSALQYVRLSSRARSEK